MANSRPELNRFRVVRYDPIMPEGWNTLRATLLGLYDDVAALAAQVPNSLFVAVRDAVTGDFVPPSWIAAVSATSVAQPEVTLPPGVRIGDRYLIANPAPGDYTITVEPRPTTGYAQATAQVSVVAGAPASVDVELVRAENQRTIPAVFGSGFAAARDQLTALQLTIGQVMDTHGHVLDPSDWGRFDDQVVLATEPGAQAVVAVGQRVNLLLAALPFPRFPRLTELPQADAQAALEAFIESYGLTLEQVEIVEEERPDGTGTVVAQVPMFDAEIFERALTVRLIVAIPERVTVPDLVGLPRDEVAGVLASVGLSLADEVGTRPTEVAEEDNLVAEQTPAAGERVLPGTAVQIVVWQFPQAIVPDLTGLTQDEASATLVGLGLALDAQVDTQPTDQPADDGRVASQAPAAGTLLPQGSTVRITLWRFPQIDVPNLLGLTQDEAAQALAGVGLTLDPNVSEQPTASAADDGRVAAQNPPAGSRVPQGSAVQIVLWRASLVVVPDVIGNPSTLAQQRLAAVNLTAAIVFRPVIGAAAEVVLEQTPAAGASVPPGTQITLVIGVLALMPELRCLPLQEAEERFRRFVRDFGVQWDEQLQILAQASDREPGTIFDQNPAAFSAIPAQLSGVSLTVRRAPLPDVRCLLMDKHRVIDTLKEWADHNGIALADIQVEGQASTRPTGTVLAQTPAALSGDYPLDGLVIRLVVSDQTQAQPGWPEMTCMTQDEAAVVIRRIIQEFHVTINPRIRNVISERPDGTILAHSPKPGTPILPGQAITATLNVARAPLPDVVCLNADQAKARITEATAERELIFETAEDTGELPGGTVMAQKPLPYTPIPAPGQRIQVSVVISRGDR